MAKGEFVSERGSSQSLALYFRLGFYHVGATIVISSTVAIFVPLVESGICLLVDVATLSTIYDVRHSLLLPPGYPTQELISRPRAVRHPSSTPTLAACVSFLHYNALLSIIHIYHLNLHNTAHTPFPAFRPPSYKHLLPLFSPLRSTQPIRPSLHIT